MSVSDTIAIILLDDKHVEGGYLKPQNHASRSTDQLTTSTPNPTKFSYPMNFKTSPPLNLKIPMPHEMSDSPITAQNGQSSR